MAATLSQMSFVSKFLVFILSFLLAYASSESNVSLIPLPAKGHVVGPVSIAFDPLGGGPYAGVDDGRILKYSPSSKSFQEYAINNMKRPRRSCDGVPLPKLPLSCGRPLGLSFNNKTGNLDFTDAYYGLSTVNGTAGGNGTRLATAAKRRPFFLLTAVVSDVSTGDIYATDYSRIYNLRNISISTLNTTDATGRLVKYNQKTKQTTVLLDRDLHGAAGVAISNDSSFLIVSELITRRLTKYWLTGSKANRREILRHLDGCPTEIKRSADGNFWVGVNIRNSKNQTIMFTPTAFKVDASGKTLQKLDISKEFNNNIVTVVQEHNGKLYVGSFGTSFIGVYPLNI